MSYIGADRRSGLDRRAIPSHGRRTTYQAGCRCLQCRRGNASYQTQIRQAKAKGQRLPGMRVSASQTWRRIRLLRIEGFTLAELARRLGLHAPMLQFDTRVVTVRTEQRMEAFYVAVMAEGPELPLKR